MRMGLMNTVQTLLFFKLQLALNPSHNFVAGPSLLLPRVARFSELKS
jgi:hypothetical protein